MTQSFQPPVRTLMGPGPSDIHPRVLAAMARPTIGHLDPAFITMMDEVKSLLSYAFQTTYPLTMPVSAPGSAGMETCLVNLLECGDTALICINGVFGGRMKAICERIGVKVITVEDDWGKPVSVDKVDAALKANPEIKLVGFVHAETSTGARSDAEAIAKLAQAADALTVCDTVTSLAGVELKVEDWDSMRSIPVAKVPIMRARYLTDHTLAQGGRCDRGPQEPRYILVFRPQSRHGILGKWC